MMNQIDRRQIQDSEMMSFKSILDLGHTPVGSETGKSTAAENTTVISSEFASRVQQFTNNLSH
jgi:hypothetical protein